LLKDLLFGTCPFGRGEAQRRESAPFRPDIHHGTASEALDRSGVVFEDLVIQIDLVSAANTGDLHFLALLFLDAPGEKGVGIHLEKKLLKTPRRFQEYGWPIFRRSSMFNLLRRSGGDLIAFHIMKQEKGQKVKKKSGSAFP
jgi:hypothetical protein